MAKVIFRYPSKKIQFGYVQVEVDGGADDLTPTKLGALYVQSVLDFQAAEIDAWDEAQRDFTKTQEAVTELFKKELGATVVSEEETKAPWEKPIKAEPQAKPWEETKAEVKTEENESKPWEAPSFDFE